MLIQIGHVLALVGLVLAIREANNGEYPDDCPSMCVDAGPNPVNWTNIHNLDFLKTCDESVIFDFNIQSPVTDPKTILTIRACVASENQTFDSPSPIDVPQQKGLLNLVVPLDCGAKATNRSVAPQIKPFPSLGLSYAAPLATDVVEAARVLSNFVATGAECGTTILFTKHKSAVVGLFSGGEITKRAVQRVLGSFSEKGLSVLQVCEPSHPARTIGIVSSRFDRLTDAQSDIRSLSMGLCLNNTIPTTQTAIEALISTMDESVDLTINQRTNRTRETNTSDPYPLSPSAECRTEEVHSHIKSTLEMYAGHWLTHIIFNLMILSVSTRGPGAGPAASICRLAN